MFSNSHHRHWNFVTQSKSITLNRDFTVFTASIGRSIYSIKTYIRAYLVQLTRCHILYTGWKHRTVKKNSRQVLVVTMLFVKNSIFEFWFISEIETLINFKFKSDFHRSIELISIWKQVLFGITYSFESKIIRDYHIECLEFTWTSRVRPWNLGIISHHQRVVECARFTTKKRN